MTEQIGETIPTPDGIGQSVALEHAGVHTVGMPSGRAIGMHAEFVAHWASVVQALYGA